MFLEDVGTFSNIRVGAGEHLLLFIIRKLLGKGLCMEQENTRIEQLAAKLLKLTKDTLVIHMRFLDTAIFRLQCISKPGLKGVACDGEHFYYDSVYLLEQYREDENAINHIYLHALLHCIFFHSFHAKRMHERLWNLACDIAVENIIQEMRLNKLKLKDEAEKKMRLMNLKKQVKFISAERVYKHFMINDLSIVDLLAYERLFQKDLHIYWNEAETYEISNEDWKKISERLKAEIQSFSKDKNNSESLEENLKEVTKKRYDYSSLLRSFLAMGEEMVVNDEEFDYIYYTYGLTCYKNMPLIEPLEYKDVKMIRDFVIVLDTSASCKGSIVQSFLSKTYQILNDSQNFFKKVNIHIIQCDNEVQSDKIIKNEDDFRDFLKNGRLSGFGGTDFRPAFTYVEQLIGEGEFENLKGMIYFTDGYGIYPEKAPEYDCMFAFLGEDDRRPKLPWWAIPVVLDEEQMEMENKSSEEDAEGREHL